MKVLRSGFGAQDLRDLDVGINKGVKFRVSPHSASRRHPRIHQFRVQGFGVYGLGFTVGNHPQSSIFQTESALSTDVIE